MKGLLSFKKEELVNLENSLKHEILCTNRAGGYTSTTIVGCNTRKYHGLLVCPIDQIDGENYVLLSTVDETLVKDGQEFNLATHRYPGVYSPKGHKYLREFDYAPTATFKYRVGDMIITKQLILVHDCSQILIKYTLEGSETPTSLRLKPMLAFRNRHRLSKANYYANQKYLEIDNGIATRLYEAFPELYMQLNKKNKFVAQPDWYYNVEYLEERNRGYPYQEDLFSHGYFDIPFKNGESVIFSASLNEEKSNNLTRLFNSQLAKRPPKDTYLNCMKNAAQQFVAERNGKTEIVAGYPWFGRWGRDTFIALPGLTLAGNYRPEICKAVLDTMTSEINNGLFPNVGKSEEAAYNSVDAPMWYFWSIQKYVQASKNYKEVWADYGEKMKSLLNKFRSGVNEHIKMTDNKLIWAKEPGRALTWMDAVVFGNPVTQRGGYTVEVNALWYNAIQFTLELARKFGDNDFVKKWEKIPTEIVKSFNDAFWNPKLGYLADYVDENGQNMDLRSNQIIACSLDYSLIDSDKKRSILEHVQQELLTPKGLRTLSPKNPMYKGICAGDQPTRDMAYHQGTVWVWQLGHYVEACFKLIGKDYVKDAERIIENFKKDVGEYGIACVAEIYDGNPHYHPGGSISQAWSVSEILRIFQMIDIYKNTKK